MKKIEKDLRERKESLLKIRNYGEKYLKNTNMDQIMVSGTKKYPKYYLIKQDDNGKIDDRTYISARNTQLIQSLCKKKIHATRQKGNRESTQSTRKIPK